MLIRPRIIPTLLLKGQGLVKTVKFSNPTYIGDPMVAAKIFNEREVDEIIILDIEASKNKKGPQFDLLSELATECFMPLCYGGGISTFEQAEKLFKLGIEKVCLNTAVLKDPQLIKKISDHFGAQAVVVSIDVKKNFFGRYGCYFTSGMLSSSWTPLALAQEVEKLGAGEILINSIDRDGTMTGYDLALITEITKNVSVPVIACGGAAVLEDFKSAIDNGASAAAAGSYFVFRGKHKAVLISYPDASQLKTMFNSAF